MCAKPSKRRAAPSAAPVAAVAPGATAAATAGPTAVAATPWTESADPRRRLLGQAVLWCVWLYVGALWLLALDQFFNWGLFGPKLPALP